MFTISNMPSLTPGDWACYQPPVSSPLRPSNNNQTPFFNSSPPGSPTRSSPIRGFQESHGTTSMLGSVDFDFSTSSSCGGNIMSSPSCGTNRYSRFAGRQARPNPVAKKREEEQATRRRLFLKNVRDRADDNRFEKRSIEAHAVRNWHQEHQEYLARKAHEASTVDWEMDAFIEDAISAQQEPEEELDLPDMEFDDYPSAAELEYEAMMAESKKVDNYGGHNIPMSEWDMDDDILLDLVRNEEAKQGKDVDMMQST